MTPVLQHPALQKWNSRLVAASGLSTLAALPDVNADLRGVGVVVITSAAIGAIAVRDILGRREALHGLGLEPPAAADIPPGAPTPPDDQA